MRSPKTINDTKLEKKKRRQKEILKVLGKNGGGGVQSQGELEIKSGNTSLISASEKQ